MIIQGMKFNNGSFESIRCKPVPITRSVGELLSIGNVTLTVNKVDGVFFDILFSGSEETRIASNGKKVGDNTIQFTNPAGLIINENIKIRAIKHPDQKVKFFVFAPREIPISRTAATDSTHVVANPERLAKYPNPIRLEVGAHLTAKITDPGLTNGFGKVVGVGEIIDVVFMGFNGNKADFKIGAPLNVPVTRELDYNSGPFDQNKETCTTHYLAPNSRNAVVFIGDAWINRALAGRDIILEVLEVDLNEKWVKIGFQKPDFVNFELKQPSLQPV